MRARSRSKPGCPTEIGSTFRDYCLEQLEGLGRVTGRAMFGGFGIYCGGVFFAIVYRGNLYFRTGEETRAAYEEKGMRPFAPRAGQVLKTYYQVPSEVLDRVPELIAWARAALGAAGKAPPPRTGFTAPRRV